MSKGRIIGTTFLLICMCFTHTSALATVKYPLSKPEKWTSGMEADTYSITNGVNITLDSTKVNDELNTAYIFNTGFSFTNSTSALKFHISQHSTGNLWLDFILEDKNKNKKTLGVDGAAILYRDGSDVPEIVKLKDISLSLGKEFNGYIYIPFRYLKIGNTNYTQENFDIKSISSSGFTFTLDGSGTSEIELKDLNLLNEDEDPNLNTNLDAEVVGEQALQISEVAETISQYSIEGNEKSDFSFIPIEGLSGISITKDGVLTIGENATNQIVTIKALNKEGEYISKDVTIYKSWVDTQNDQTIKIPKANQIKAITNNYEIFSNTNVLLGIRASCIIGAIIFGLSYYLSRKKFKH